MYGTAVPAADTPAADIFFGSAFLAIGLVFVVFRRGMFEDSSSLFFRLLPEPPRVEQGSVGPSSWSSDCS